MCRWFFIERFADFRFANHNVVVDSWTPRLHILLSTEKSSASIPTHNTGDRASHNNRTSPEKRHRNPPSTLVDKPRRTDRCPDRPSCNNEPHRDSSSRRDNALCGRRGLAWFRNNRCVARRLLSGPPHPIQRRCLPLDAPRRSTNRRSNPYRNRVTPIPPARTPTAGSDAGGEHGCSPPRRPSSSARSRRGRRRYNDQNIPTRKFAYEYIRVFPTNRRRHPPFSGGNRGNNSNKNETHPSSPRIRRRALPLPDEKDNHYRVRRPRRRNNPC